MRGRWDQKERVFNTMKSLELLGPLRRWVPHVHMHVVL